MGAVVNMIWQNLVEGGNGSTPDSQNLILGGWVDVAENQIETVWGAKGFTPVWEFLKKLRPANWEVPAIRGGSRYSGPRLN